MKKMVEPLDRRSFLWVAAGVLAALLPVLPGFPLWLSGLLMLIVALGIGLKWRGVTLPTALRIVLTVTVAALAIAGAGYHVSQETGAALLAAMLASKLLETGTVRDGRSACSFALFAVMAGFLRDQGPTTLLLALLACLLIIAALARLSQLQLPIPPPARRVPSSLWHSLRLLAISLPLALVMFFLFPRFPEPLWGAQGPDEQARSGLSNEMSPGDFVEMLIDDSPALRVTFEDETPPRSAMYWRGPVLSNFDGRRWSRWQSALFSPEAELVPLGPVIHHEVMQEPSAYRYLIGLDVPMDIPDDARMGSDRSIFAPRKGHTVHRHRVGSLIEYRLQADMPPHSRQHHQSLPSGYNSRTASLMEQWATENADPDALIQRALDWFHSEFVYSLAPPPLGRDSVDDFLFNTKEGFCEHFSSAFAVMMRSAGIPARVVTGYQGGTYNRVGDYWLIRNSDAHAWTEVWLEHRGWVRIDPTAAVAPERIRDGLSGIVPPPGALSQWAQPLWDSLDTLRRGWNYLIVDFNATRQRALLSRIGLDPQDWRQLGIALIVGIALALLASFAVLWRGERSRPTDPLSGAWQRFVERLAGMGLEKLPSEPASAYAARATAYFSENAEQLALLMQRYIAQQYAENAVPDSERKQLIRDLRRFRPRRPRPRSAS